MEAKKYISEFIGTFVLVFMGCGSAIFLGVATNGGHLAVALSFGLSIVAMAYVIGNISGCHINPAVSLSLLMSKKMTIKDFCAYVIAQILGAIAGAGILQLLLSLTGLYDHSGALGSNAIGGLGVAGAFLIEVILTFIFVIVVLGIVHDKTKASVGGIVIGLSLTFVHVVGIPFTGTSVNPARSLGPAIFAGTGALSDVWLFILAPLLGAALAAVVFMCIKPKTAE